MQPAEFREMSDQELASKEMELVETLMLLRLRHRTNQIESTAKLASTRRDLARLKTIQRERAGAASGGA